MDIDAIMLLEEMRAETDCEWDIRHHRSWHVGIRLPQHERIIPAGHGDTLVEALLNALNRTEFVRWWVIAKEKLSHDA